METLSAFRKRAFSMMNSLVVVSVCLLIVSCVKDAEFPDAVDGVDGEALVRLRLCTGARALPDGQTRAVDDVENNIGSLCVLVLKSSNGGIVYYNYEYMVHVSNVTQVESSPSTATFEAKLPTSYDPVKLIILANVDMETLHAQLPDPGTSEAELRKMLTQAFPASGHIDAMPMYGEIKLASLKAGLAQTVTVTMVRALAHVSVNLNKKLDPHTFRLNSIGVYKANDRIQLIPTAVNMSGTTATKPSVPASGVTPTTYNGYTAADPTNMTFDGIYLPESTSKTATTPAQWLEATCIIVGGYYADDEQPTFYRIDFNSGVSGHPFGQILRNYRYVFNIMNVTARGWAMPGEAATNRATSLTVSITAWSQSNSDIYIQKDAGYIYISDRDKLLNPYEGRTDSITVETNMPFTFTDGSNAAVQGVDGATMDAIDYGIALRRDPADETRYTFYLTTQNTNTNNAVYPFRTLTITAGESDYTITVAQDYFNKNYNRTVNVLSIGTSYGSLGGVASFGQPTGLAHKIKDVLMNPAHFGPSGTVSITGFNFEYIPAAAADNDNDVENLKLLLQNIDIVRLSYGTAVSNAACAEAIVDWTLASKHHLLFLTADSEVSNVAVRNALNARLDYRLGWRTFGNAGTITWTPDELAQLGNTPNNFLWGTAYPTPVPGDEEIMGATAAFGAVDRRKAFPLSDGTSGWVAGPYPYRSVNTASTSFDTAADIPVIPLIVLAPTFNPPGGPYSAGTNPAHITTQHMVVGVNPEAGIAYIGEAQIGSRSMLDQNGDLSEYGENSTDAALFYNRNISPTKNELNRIYCNLWAWAVRRVMEEY